MKKILIIDFFFPPLVWGWRCALMAKYFVQKDWNVSVLCADPSAYPYHDKTVEIPNASSLNVYRIAAPKRRFTTFGKVWAGKMVGKMERLLSSQRNQVVYTLVPPFEIAQAVLHLKKSHPFKWICDFRDAWTANDFINNRQNRRPWSALIRPMRQANSIQNEKRVLASADHIFTATQGIKESFSENDQSLNENKITVIPSGYDEEAFQSVQPRRLPEGTMNLIFLGTLNRSFIPLVKNFISVVKNLGLPIKIFFIGASACREFVSDSDQAVCLKPMPRREAHAYAIGADFLLCFARREMNRWMVSSKLYSYLRAGRPVLAMMPLEREAARILETAGAGIFLSYEATELKKQLRHLFLCWQKGDFENFTIRTDYVKRFEQKALFERMFPIFQNLGEE